MPGPADTLVVEFLRRGDCRCPDCGYALDGAAADRCPECGAGLVLRLHRRRDGDAAWLASLFAGALAAALAVFLLVRALGPVWGVIEDPRIVQLVAAGRAPASILPHWPTVIGLLLLATGLFALLGILVAARRRCSAWPRWRRYAVAVAMLAAPLVVLATALLLPRLG